MLNRIIYLKILLKKEHMKRSKTERSLYKEEEGGKNRRQNGKQTNLKFSNTVGFMVAKQGSNRCNGE